MVITVTHTDMVHAVINSQSSGPLALAAQRAGLRGVLVGDRRLSCTAPDGTRAYYELSDAAVRFQRRLHYTDRHEMSPDIKVKRNKKGDISGYSSVSFAIHPAEVAKKEAA